jgi:hypothetical protein
MKIEITKETVAECVGKKKVRIPLKALLILIATFTSGVFFGLFLPFFLLAMEIVPHYGLGSVVYIYGGVIFGCLFGGISSICSLCRNKGVVTRYYLIMMGTLLALSAAYLICYLAMTERFAHI